MSSHLKVFLMQCSFAESVLTGGIEHRQLKISQFQFGRDEGGEFVVYMENGSKNHSGSYNDKGENKVVKHYANLSLNERAMLVFCVRTYQSCTRLLSKRMCLLASSVVGAFKWHTSAMVWRANDWKECTSYMVATMCKKQTSRVIRLTIALERQQLLVCLRVVFQKNLYRNPLATVVWRHCVHTKEPPRHSISTSNILYSC